MKNYFKILLVAVAFLSLSFVKFDKKEINVVIDAGHGGTDLGVSIDDITEKSLTEAISKKIQSMNNDVDVKIHFTRIDDSNLDLAERARIVNSYQPDLAISLHVNHNKNPEANGYEIYISNNSSASEKSKELANKLSASFAKNSPLKNRGVKDAPYMILKKSEYPTMLVELGFISNEFDRNYVTNEAGQTQIAQTILSFVSDLKQ